MRHFSASLQALAAGALFLTTGCSPSVYTEHSKELSGPHRRFDRAGLRHGGLAAGTGRNLGQRHGQGQRIFGQLQLCEGHAAAKDETNKIGGNGLHLFWHKEPSALGSSCHRIAAHMLLLPDSVYTASYFDNVAAQNAGWRHTVSYRQTGQLRRGGRRPRRRTTTR